MGKIFPVIIDTPALCAELYPRLGALTVEIRPLKAGLKRYMTGPETRKRGG